MSTFVICNHIDNDDEDEDKIRYMTSSKTMEKVRAGPTAKTTAGTDFRKQMAGK